MGSIDGKGFLAVLWVGALFLAGCASAAPPSQDQAAAVARPGSGTEEQCAPGREQWRSPGAPVRGGTFARALFAGSGQGHLDLTVAGVNPSPIAQVYQKLVTSRVCFSEDITVAPDLARTWDIATDQLTWTFKLRDDVRWHNREPVNGRGFTSADVAWTIDLQKKGGQLAPYWANVTYETPDPSTIVLRLASPDADFLAKLTNGASVIMPREVKEQRGDFKREAVGTGPFMLKEFREQQLSLLTRNPDYYLKGADGQALPYLDEVRLQYFGDIAAVIAALRAGQIDLNDSQGMRKGDFELIRQANPRVRGMEVLTGSSWGLFFNLSKKPFDDLRVRKAFALAVDTTEVIEGSYQGAAVASGFMPASIREFAWSPAKNAEKFKADPEGAKRLLAEAGYQPGQMELVLDVSQQYVLDAEIVAKQLEKVGVKASINVGSAGTTSVMASPNFLLVWGGLTPTAYFPDRWLNAPLHSRSRVNYIQLADPKVDAFAEAQLREMDLAKRKQIINDVQDYLYEVMPFVPGVTRSYFYIYGCRVKNMRPYSPTHNLDGLAEAWLDSSGC